MAPKRTITGTRLAAPLARKPDIKQFGQACREVGSNVEERYRASDALHAEKEASGEDEHLAYVDLVAWLQEWKQR